MNEASGAQLCGWNYCPTRSDNRLPVTSSCWNECNPSGLALSRECSGHQH